MSRRDTFATLLARAGEARPQTLAMKWWGVVRVWLAAQHVEKRMRLVESVSLGERRFVAVVQVDQREFLIGTSAAGVTLLSELGARQ